MLVPAIAFSWWLVSVPMGKVPVEPPASAAAWQRAQAAMIAPSTRAAAPEPKATAPAVPGDTDADTNRTVTTDESAPDDTTSEPTERVLYRGLITPAIARQARAFLDLPMGAERTADVEGHHFVFVLERHYHPPGFVGAPTGWHKGVTVYEMR
jgi:hypothetical protein